MDVRVDEAGDDRAAAEIDHACPRVGLREQVGGRAGRDDPVSAIAKASTTDDRPSRVRILPLWSKRVDRLRGGRQRASSDTANAAGPAARSAAGSSRRVSRRRPSRHTRRR